jgi:hypothetical protein
MKTETKLKVRVKLNGLDAVMRLGDAVAEKLTELATLAEELQTAVCSVTASTVDRDEEPQPQAADHNKDIG